MSLILEKNLESLKKNIPDLYEKVCSIKNNSFSLKDLNDGWYQLNSDASLKHPKELLSQLLKEQPLKFPLIVVFYGMDLGYHIKKILDEPHPKTQNVIVIEKSLEIFKLALTVNDFSKYFESKNITWFIGLSVPEIYENTYKYFRGLNQMITSQCRENLMWLSCMKRDGDYYLNAAKNMETAIKDLISRIAADPEDNFRGLINLFENRTHLINCHDFFELKDIFKDKWGVVVSTGPSLTHSLEYLKSIQDKAVLFCVDSAAKILQDNGITPHFISNLERVPGTQRFFENLNSSWPTKLVCVPVAFENSIKLYQSQPLFLYNYGLRYEWLCGQRQRFEVGTSAATMALVGLSILGCKKIILVGQDLAYRRGDFESHATGAHDSIRTFEKEKVAELIKDEESWVVGNNNEKILTQYVYKKMARDFSHLIYQHKIECFNAIPKDFGMKIEGCTHLEPENAFNMIQDKPYDFFKLINQHTTKISQEKISEINVEFKKRYTGATLALAKARDESLALWEAISIEYRNHLPTVIDETSEKEWLRRFSLFEVGLNKVTENPVFPMFLWSFIQYDYVQNNITYLNYLKQGSLNRENISYCVQIFWDTLQKIFIWSSRLEHLMRASLKTKEIKESYQNQSNITSLPTSPLERREDA